MFVKHFAPCSGFTMPGRGSPPVKCWKLINKYNYEQKHKREATGQNLKSNDLVYPLKGNDTLKKV